MKDLALHYWAEAPGSCMIFGEHAVLRGYPAIVCALRPRLRVYAKKRDDGWLHVCAMGLSKSVIWQERNSLSTDFRFLEACISSFDEASTGLDIIVESNLVLTKGFGSSAALIAAALLAISLALESPQLLEKIKKASLKQKEEVFLKGLSLLRSVQGFGSGADLAASIYGGCLEYSYSQKPKTIKPISEMYLVYSGHKTPTSEVLKRLHDKEVVGQLDLSAVHELGQTSLAALALWPSIDDLNVRKHLCQRHQEAMRRLELFDDGLENVCQVLTDQNIEHKISGSGLGDSVLCFREPFFNTRDVTKVENDLAGLQQGFVT